MRAGIIAPMPREARSHRLRRLLLAGALCAALLGLVACGETVIDDAKTEGALKQNLESIGPPVTAVSCPSGVEVVAGTTFECEVTRAGGRKQTATLRIVNEDADVEVTGLRNDG